MKPPATPGPTREGLQEAAIRQQCKLLHLPTVAAQFARLTAYAGQQQQSHGQYLEAVLSAELDEREHHAVTRRLSEARLPRVKTLEEFDFGQAPHLPALLLRQLAEGEYLTRAEPVILIGEPGTGKTHLATGLAVAACRQRKRVRFATTAALMTELVEAKQRGELSRVLGRWSRLELIVLDEWGYVPLAEVGAELLFQLISERAEKTAIVLTTNLPFSEWPQVVPGARLCKAMLDRLTDRAHIIETGTESYRFRRTLAGQSKPARKPTATAPVAAVTPSLTER